MIAVSVALAPAAKANAPAEACAPGGCQNCAHSMSSVANACSTCDTCGQQSSITASLDWLYMWREHPLAQTIVTSPTGSTLLNGRDFNFDPASGLDFKLGYNLGDCNGVEARYFGIFDATARYNVAYPASRKAGRRCGSGARKRTPVRATKIRSSGTTGSITGTPGCANRSAVAWLRRRCSAVRSASWVKAVDPTELKKPSPDRVPEGDQRIWSRPHGATGFDPERPSSGISDSFCAERQPPQILRRAGRRGVRQQIRSNSEQKTPRDTNEGE